MRDYELRDILLVEDNPDHAELMVRALNKHYHDLRVDVSSSGHNCLEKLKSKNYDLIILDYTLPDKDGLEVLEHIENNTVPVIMVTGQGDTRVAVEAMKRGSYDYITKSKDYLVTLPVVIEKAMNRYRTEVEKKKLEEKLIQSEKLRALGQMAGGVAHDFNNVLTIILGKTQLIKQRLNEYESGAITQTIHDFSGYLDIIEKSALDGAQTVKRIQKLTQTKSEESFYKVDLNDVVTDAYNATKPIWKNQAEKEGIYIEFTLELNEVEPAAGNEAELREILNNMIFNSIDAIPEGGEIKIKTGSDKTHNYIRLSDTGIGMSEEVKDRIFDPFFTTKDMNASGLGLSVSYGILARHGGDVEAISEKGKGSTFIIKLPIDWNAVEEPEISAIKIREKNTRILVIDDQEEIRDILQEMLTAMGINVDIAQGGEEGLSLFEQFDFDLVFTDLGMPGVSGWEVAKRIKDAKPTTPVALITGWGDQLSDKQLEEGAVDLFLAKPFKIKQLQNLVGEALRIKEKVC